MIRIWTAALALIVSTPLFAADAANAIARMRKDLTFLASAECEGRGPGTAGIDKAADYIAETFRAAGLKGAMPDGSYFQPFTFKGSPTLGEDLLLELSGPGGKEVLKLGEQFQPLGLTGKGQASGELAFVGYGISVDSAHYDDFAGIDVAGKIVILIRKSPRYNATENRFVDDQTQQKVASLATKLENAQKHKAAGVILVNDVTEKDDTLMDFKFSVFGNPVEIPAFHVRKPIIDGILKASMGKSLSQIEEEIAKDLKPQSKLLSGQSAKMNVSVERKTVGIKNVVATLEGAGPLANETVVIGAHYDHLGMGGNGSLAPGVKAIHFGADDNGSGTTALLELARRFGGMKDRQGRRLVFLAFSGEEVNLLGSAHYVKEPLFPLNSTTVMINLDMVGRMAPDPKSGKGKIEIGGTGSAKGFDQLVDKLNAKYDFAVKKSASGVGPSDHTSFYMKGVPVFFFFTGTHKEYHKPADTVDLINFDDMSRIADMVEELIVIQASAEARPEYVKMAIGPASMGSGRGNVPRLGFMPGDYGEDEDGVLIASVTKDGPADKGGLRDGDRIVAVAGKPVKNMTAYMTVLGGQKRGEPLELTIIRKNEKITLKVTPQ